MKRIFMSCVLIAALLAVSSLPALAAPTSTLKVGSKGSEVIEVQRLLAKEGYLEERFVSGFFGPHTKDAVLEYQRIHHINQTGVVAAYTLAAMFESSTLSTTVSMKKGDESAEVKKLQQALCDMSYLDETSVTGHFGDKTESAVKKFQGDNNLPTTGIVASQTIAKINELTDLKPLDENRVYELGNQDDGVKALQERLCALGYLEPKYLTGYYGAVTVAAVKKFQKNNQISQTGTVATLTLKALNSASAKTQASIKEETPSGETESIAKPGTLRYGDTGSKVKALQNDLKTLGYFTGTPTGEFGNVTKNAVIKFQKAYSLTADGIVNSKTSSKIAAAISAKKTVVTPKPKTKATATPKNSKATAAPTKAPTVTSPPSSNYNSANMAVINQAKATLSDAQMEDVKLIARLVHHESNCCSYRCQLAVASVVMNRVSAFKLSVRGVLFQKNQFCSEAELMRTSYTTSNLYAAMEAYMGVRPISSCLYFCSAGARYTCWAGKNRTYYCAIDGMCFFL